jgi:predicted nuclease of predicted toxin-antitoxin system
MKVLVDMHLSPRWITALEHEGPSVLRIQDGMPETLGSRGVQILQQYGEVLEQGALVTVDETRARTRVFPFR